MKLPLKYRKEILEFANEYAELAGPRKIRITIPKREVVIPVVWSGDNKIQINCDDDNLFGYDIDDLIYTSGEFKTINNKIKSFIAKTRKFEKKNKFDLWSNVLWTFRPENGETLQEKLISWYSD